MKIFVTGANGLLGQKLISLMAAKPEIELVASSRGEKRIKTNNYAYECLDITDRDKVRQVIHRVRPDMIIHAAAITNVDQCEINKDACLAANVTAVKDLVHAAEENGCFFLYVSTDFVFSGEAGPYEEGDVPEPVNFYGESKLQAEEVVKSSTLNWAIARTVLVYGVLPDMSRSNIVLWVKNNLEKGKAIRVVNDQWRTPTLAEDLALGCYLIAKKQAKGIFHLSGKDRMTPYELAIKTAEYFNLDKNLITATDAAEFKEVARRPPRTGFVIDKAVNLLGYQPHSFEEGLALMADQMKYLSPKG